MAKTRIAGGAEGLIFMQPFKCDICDTVKKAKSSPMCHKRPMRLVTE